MHRLFKNSIVTSGFCSHYKFMKNVLCGITFNASPAGKVRLIAETAITAVFTVTLVVV
jgi:hypothetical protein